ncbi:hypothetical protein JCGZ_10321 [Jatropha curcas]|uniref:Uncharacterized protein n=1 Tax=Jatropha curcas TaxID=180498 RepID=A0A067KU93_JATCU|nr:hypothetical protein JCGZ_10321 [Jatropha curcas]
MELKTVWIPQLLTKIRGQIFSRKEGMIRIRYHSTMELKGAWVPQLLTKIRGRIFSRKGGMIRICYHSTIELKEAWGASKFLTLMEAHVEIESEIPAYGMPWPY